MSLVSALHLTVFICTGTPHTGKPHCSTLSVLLHSWLRGRETKEAMERNGGGAKSSIIYGWNLIRGRSFRWAAGVLTQPLFAATSHCRYPVEKKKAEIWKWESCLRGLCSAIQMCLRLHSIHFLFFSPSAVFSWDCRNYITWFIALFGCLDMQLRVCVCVVGVCINI